MPIENETKQRVHNLVEQLGPNQIAAIRQLLEVMVVPKEDVLSEEDTVAVAAPREHFRQHPEGGVSFERFAAECGFTLDQILGDKA